jgi:hypothetical protein
MLPVINDPKAAEDSLVGLLAIRHAVVVTELENHKFATYTSSRDFFTAMSLGTQTAFKLYEFFQAQGMETSALKAGQLVIEFAGLMTVPFEQLATRWQNYLTYEGFLGIANEKMKAQTLARLLCTPRHSIGTSDAPPN